MAAQRIPALHSSVRASSQSEPVLAVRPSTTSSIRGWPPVCHGRAEPLAASGPSSLAFGTSPRTRPLSWFASTSPPADAEAAPAGHAYDPERPRCPSTRGSTVLCDRTRQLAWRLMPLSFNGASSSMADQLWDHRHRTRGHRRFDRTDRSRVTLAQRRARRFTRRFQRWNVGPRRPRRCR